MGIRVVDSGFADEAAAVVPSPSNPMNIALLKTGVLCVLLAVTGFVSAAEGDFRVLFARNQEKDRTAEDQFKLAECYANGDGVAKNLTKAKLWYANAGANGYVPAWKKLGALTVKKVQLKPTVQAKQVSPEVAQAKGLELVRFLRQSYGRGGRLNGTHAKVDMKEVVRLVQEGAYMNAVTPQKELYESALGIALEQNDLKMCDFLLAHGADPNGNWRNYMKNIRMYFPHGTEAERKAVRDSAPRGAVVDMGVSDKKRIAMASKKLKFLVDRGADPTMRCTTGRTMLHWFAISGSPEAISALIKCGVPVDQPNDPDEVSTGKKEDRDEARRTALYAAIEYRNVGATQELIRNKANVNYVDAQGVTPLDYAYEVQKSTLDPKIFFPAREDQVRRITAVIELLQKAGAKRGKNAP